MLETRLDNVVYRLGFASSRAQARQLVRHGHFHVNGRRVNIPSYQVKPDDIVTITPGSSRRAGHPRRDRPDRLRRPVAAGRPRGPDRQDPQVARARRDRHAGPGVVDRRALLEVAPAKERKEWLFVAPDGFPDPEDRPRGGRRAPRRLRDRAARPRLRLHVRQLAAPRAALVARGRRSHLGQDRGRRARVHDAAGRPRGRHRHHPQPQEPVCRPARRVARDRGAPARSGAPAPSPPPTSRRRPTSRSSTRTSRSPTSPTRAGSR